MINKSVKRLRLFEIIDDAANHVWYGCNQEWYPSLWQRMAGCGPTVASTIIHYLDNSSLSEEDVRPVHKKEIVEFMESVWRYVTPTVRGIPSTKILYDDILKYAKAKSLDLSLNVINIPKCRSDRPAFGDILEFIDEALSNDSPVAFLNLNNGAEKELDSWHWVTVIHLEYEEDRSSAFCEILDEGIIKRINLALWYETTSIGGGFIRFRIANETPSSINTVLYR